MVTLYQTAQGNADMVLEMLRRTGHKEAAKIQAESIIRELDYVDNWLDKYAPDNIKFEVQNDLPEVDISDVQQKFLDELLVNIHDTNMEADKIHEAVYNSAVKTDLKPADAFKLLYKLFLNKDQGPKIGFFLSSLDKDFVINRIAQKG
jgi:lysyl-tRNA synthetase class 1